MYYEGTENQLDSLPVTFAIEYHKQTRWFGILSNRDLGRIPKAKLVKVGFLSDLHEAILWLFHLPVATELCKHRKLFSENFTDAGSGPSPPGLI